MFSTDDEDSLQRELAGLSKADPAYAMTLSDLATIKLNKGKTSEAQHLLEQLRILRLGAITSLEVATNPNDFHTPAISSTSHHDKPAAAADTSNPTSRSEPISTPAKTASQPAALDTLAPCSEAPDGRSSAAATTFGSSFLGATTTTTTITTTATTATTTSSTTPVLRTRGLGSAGRAMGGGVALFARALGGRPNSASGSRTGSGARSQSGSTSGEAVTRGTTSATVMTSAAAGAIVITSDKAAAVNACAALPIQDQDGRQGHPSTNNITEQVPSPDIAAGMRSGSMTQGTAAGMGELVVAEAPANGDGTDNRVSPPSLGSWTGQQAETEAAAAISESVMASPTAVPAPGTTATATCHGGDVASGGAIRQGPGTELPSWSTPPLLVMMAAASPSVDQPPPSAVAVAGAVTAAFRPAMVVAASNKRPSQAVAAVSAMLCGSNRSHITAAALMAEGSREAPASGGAAGPDDSALRATLGECTHVVEVYGLTTAVRTSHLEEFVMAMAPTDGRPLPTIKWVDDEHALLVCPDGATALWLLQEDQDLFQLRPFSEASPASRAVFAAELLPPKERPKTTAAVAKKMLSHALGMSQLRDRGAEKDLAQQRKAAREARREREQKLAAAWNDD